MAECKDILCGPVVAIGDVHGNVDNLKKLWSNLEVSCPDFADTHVVFLGDYVDRGDKVKETLNFLIFLKENRPKTHFICGNHDFALLSFLQLPPSGSADYSYQRKECLGPLSHEELLKTTHIQGLRYTATGACNCETTFASYGCKYADRDSLCAAMPQKHKAFLSSLPFVIEHEKYLFVHGGLHKRYEVGQWRGLSLEKQVHALEKKSVFPAFIEPLQNRHYDDSATLAEVHRISEQSSQRDQQLAKKIVVCGHIQTESVFFGPSVIRVDTSGGLSQFPISAVLLPAGHIFASH